jgi:hypothetical protein
MKIHQLSLFLENQPGQVVEPCRVLARAGIDIRTLTLADTQRFGILRLILSDWQAGAKALRDAGFVTNVAEVAAVEVPDRPGGLAGLLELLNGSGLNIEYLYAFTFGRGDKAVMIFRFNDPDRAIELLQNPVSTWWRASRCTSASRDETRPRLLDSPRIAERRELCDVCSSRRGCWRSRSPVSGAPWCSDRVMMCFRREPLPRGQRPRRPPALGFRLRTPGS